MARTGGGWLEGIDAVSLDCAETLLSVDWEPGQFAVLCAREAGLAPSAGAEVRYRALFGSRLGDYARACREGTSGEFWERITRDWLAAEGLPDRCEEVMEAGDELLYGEPSRVYRVFDDVFPALEALRERGLRLVVVSNWDASLEKVLHRFDLLPWFERAFASMVVGSEKPDRGIFQAAESFLGVPGERILHIGDNPVDDLEGARAAGWRSALLDRSGQSAGAIRSLLEIVGE